MTASGPAWPYDRGTTVLALTLPTGAGLVYLAAYGAPPGYLIVNASALLMAVLWARFGRLPTTVRGVGLLAFGLLAVLAIPALFGPDAEGIARWISLGGFTLHAGMATVPLLAVLAARDSAFGAFFLMGAIVIAWFQPDSASLLAVSFAAFGIWRAKRSLRAGVAGVIGLIAAIAASFWNELPPQAFVERILPDLLRDSPLVMAIMALSLLASVFLILQSGEADRAPRFALAGAMTGFIAAALLGNYPYPLIGYGAAAILGFGLALPGLRKEPEA